MAKHFISRNFLTDLSSVMFFEGSREFCTLLDFKEVFLSLVVCDSIVYVQYYIFLCVFLFFFFVFFVIVSAIYQCKLFCIFRNFQIKALESQNLELFFSVSLCFSFVWVKYVEIVTFAHLCTVGTGLVCSRLIFRDCNSLLY